MTPLISNYVMSPLFAVDTLIDPDSGLIRLIKDEYLDPDVFNMDLMSRPINEILSYVYYRSVPNPLRVLCNSSVSSKDMDDYYEDFISSRYQDIMNMSYSTELTDGLNLICKQGGKTINPTIMYYRPEELVQISQFKKFKDIKKISYQEAKEKASSFNIFYFKYIAQSTEIALESVNNSFYFSDSGLNIDKNGEINEDGFGIEFDLIQNMISRSNRINLFNFYSTDLVNRKIMEEQ